MFLKVSGIIRIHMAWSTGSISQFVTEIVEKSKTLNFYNQSGQNAFKMQKERKKRIVSDCVNLKGLNLFVSSRLPTGQTTDRYSVSADV